MFRQPTTRPGRSRATGIEVRLEALVLVGVFVVTLGAAAEASAQADPEPPAAEIVVPRIPSGVPGDGAPGLDALLSVPKDYLQPKGRVVGGAGEDEWRRRFTQVHKRLERAQTALDETKGALDNAAVGTGGSQWAVAPPGASGGGPSASDSPLSFKLRQELLRNREQLEEAERALRELRIEADLAGVPADWRDDRDVPLGKRLPDSPYYN